MARKIHTALEVVHDKLHIIHGDLSINNIVLNTDDPVIIDWELALPINSSRLFQGTTHWVSLAVAKARSTPSEHTYKRRDDFESLFFIILYWINNKTFIWDKDEDKQESLLNEVKFIKDMNILKLKKDEFKHLKKLRKTLFDNYPKDDAEKADEVFSFLD